jgi:hypothetical protein
MAMGGRARSVPRSARRAYWRRHVDAHRRSGLSQVAFCAQRGLRKGTLSFWKWKFAREARQASRRPDATGTPRTPPATVTPRFIPIHVAAPRAPRALAGPSTIPDGVEIELTLGPGRGLRVRGRVEPAWLVQVLRGIETC